MIGFLLKERLLHQLVELSLHFVSLHFNSGKSGSEIVILAGWRLEHSVCGLKLCLLLLQTFELVEKLFFVALTLLENVLFDS